MKLHNVNEKMQYNTIIKTQFFSSPSLTHYMRDGRMYWTWSALSRAYSVKIKVKLIAVFTIFAPS